MTEPCEKFLRLDEVMRRVPYSRSSIYQLAAQGKFPKPLSLGARAVAWLESDIDQFIASRIDKARSNVVAPVPQVTPSKSRPADATENLFCRFCAADMIAAARAFFGPPGRGERQYFARCDEHRGVLICSACNYCQANDATPELIAHAKLRRAVYDEHVLPMMRENNRKLAHLLNKSHRNH